MADEGFVDDGPSTTATSMGNASMVDISIGQKLVEVMKVEARTSEPQGKSILIKSMAATQAC